MAKKVIFKHTQKINWTISDEKKPSQKNNSEAAEKTRTQEEEAAFRVMSAKAASANNHIFYMVDGSPTLLWDASGVNWTRIDGTNDFAIIVDGKKISPEKLNRSYKRNDFQVTLTRNSKKYNKMVFFLSTKKMTPQEVDSYLN